MQTLRNMPKAKKEQENDTYSAAKPYSTDTNCAVNSRREQRTSLESVESLLDKENMPNNPMNNKNVLKICMKHHKLTLEAMKKHNNEIIQSVQKSNMAIVEKNEEVKNLKRIIQNMERKEKELKELDSAHASEIASLQQKCASLDSKYTSLETGYDHEITKWRITMEKKKAELATQQKRCDDLIKQLDAVKQNNQSYESQFQSVVQEKDSQITQLTMTCNQLQTQIAQIEADFTYNKHQLEQKWMAELQLTQKTQVELQAELEQKSAAITNEMERRTQIETELVLTLNKLEECEKRCVHLQEINKNLSEEASSTAKIFESEIEKQKLKIDELTSVNEAVTNAIKSKQQNYEKDINALKEANAQLDLRETALKKDLDLCRATISELKQHNEELKQHNLTSKNHWTAENGKLIEQLQKLREEQKTNLASIQAELMQRDVDIAASQEAFAELEREKNATIAELKYKINQIGYAFGQPVGTVGPQNKTQAIAPVELSGNPEQSTSIRASVLEDSSNEVVRQIQTEVNSISTNARKPRQSYKRPIYNAYKSDFNTDTSDTDDESNWEPPTKLAVPKKSLNGISNVKRSKRATPRETSDLFDQVKKS